MRGLGLRSVSVLVYRCRNAPYDLSRNDSGLPALAESRHNFLSVITFNYYMKQAIYVIIFKTQRID